MDTSFKFENQELNTFKHGFNQVLRLASGEKYEGNADFVILVWHEFQLIPAEQYRAAHYAHLKADLAICEDPNDHESYLGDKSEIYHYA